MLTGTVEREEVNIGKEEGEYTFGKTEVISAFSRGAVSKHVV